jgi:hypothetical protein
MLRACLLANAEILPQARCNRWSERMQMTGRMQAGGQVECNFAVNMNTTQQSAQRGASSADLPVVVI